MTRNVMNHANIAKARLAGQQIGRGSVTNAKDVVGWMGAMQAQDFAMSKWAVGIRLPGSIQSDIEAAINNAEIIRTHLLRPTWHLVSAEDIYWILDLTAPHIRSALKSRHYELGLSGAVYLKSNSVIEKALHENKLLSRETLIAELEKAGIATDENRASHLLLWAELEQLICSGAIINGKPGYTLLEERVPRTRPLTKLEALAKLAQKYFKSHGPATLQDFTWWSGLPAKEAKQALEMVKSDLDFAVDADQIYWFSNTLSTPGLAQDIAHFLPSFDEFIISYKDKSAVLLAENQRYAISSNGIFRPVIVLNGQVIGLWKRTINKELVNIEIDLFERPDPDTLDSIKKAALQFEKFIGVKTAVHNNF